ncbi:hypothetical protein ACFFVB_02710 [Formosa undariae]|uniref:DUF115 domain-containing protein n=1 Tax=Formosa undariae TaxID=1325436 RepID=A0ABV5EXR7_9FLAO
MIETIFKYIGQLFSSRFEKKNPKIFTTIKSKEYLSLYAESEIKSKFFQLHSMLKGFKDVSSYVDKKKKSDTVFILGSGESINDLTNEDWKEIEENNIIGLNYSFVHPIIPDYHLMEMIPLTEMQDFFCEQTQKRYKDVDMFFQYKHVIKSKFNLKKYNHKERLYVHTPHLLPTIYPEVLEAYFEHLFSKNNLKLNDLVHHNSHIGCAVMFAQALGYKKIVMLGIDLNNGDYFTDSKIKTSVYGHTDSYDKINKLRTLHFNNVKEFTNKVHPTVDKDLMNSRGGVTMHDYFKVYSKVFIDNTDYKLFIGSNKSTLSKTLPVYPFECNQ